MENILIWGTGKFSKKFTETALNDKEINIIGFIDNNPEKQGQIFFEKEIYGPDVILKINFDKIVICTVYIDEIRKQILENYPKVIDCVRDHTHFFYQNEILARYKNSVDPEIQEVVKFLEKRDLQVFNYGFIDKYKQLNTDPVYDEINKLYYIEINEKKLYFARHLDNPKKVKQYFQSISVEQDIESPHRYLFDSFDVQENDIIVDVGVAEGNFTFSIIDKVKKAYLIEADEGWIDALKLTFSEYQDKVVYINKFVKGYTSGKYETLDNIIKEPVNFIKMDIEGSECDALDGVIDLVKISPKMKIAVCSYHNDYDEIILKMKLNEMGFNCTTTSGYMWSPYNRIVTTKLCRGIVRGVKEQ